MGCACACTNPHIQALSCLEPLNALCPTEVDKKTVSYPATTLHRIDTHYWVQYAWRDTQNESRLETALWNSAAHQVCRVKLEVKKYIFHVLKVRVLLLKKKPQPNPALFSSDNHHFTQHATGKIQELLSNIFTTLVLMLECNRPHPSIWQYVSNGTESFLLVS